MAYVGDTSSLWSDRVSVLDESPIEPDSGEDDQSEISSTRSLRDSIIGYITENGRTYNRYGDYFLPTDQPENERLTLQYVVMQQLFGNKVHFAPLTKPRRVLDIGTGNGVWCIDMAKKYPTAHITGTDLSLNQPLQGTYPENCHWLLDDANNEDWGSRKWDYIHTRMMLGAFNDFRVILKRAFDYLEPGGYMESQEMWPRAMCDDGTLNPQTHKFTEWIANQDQAAMRLGMPLRIANKLRRWYKEAGFVDVKEEIMRIPINGWPRDPRFKMLGKWWARSLLDGLQGFSMMLFTRAFNWTPEEVEVYLVDVRKSISDRSVHAYHQIYVVHGRKPTLEEQQRMDEQRAQERAEVMGHARRTTNGDSGVHLPERPASGRPATAQTNGAHEINQMPQQNGTSSQNSNRRPRQPFSASPHPNV